MNVSVGREWEEFVRGKVESGDYASSSEVVRDDLRLLREKDLLFAAKLQALRGEIQLGIDQVAAGDLLDGPEAMAQLRRALLKSRE